MPTSYSEPTFVPIGNVDEFPAGFGREVRIGTRRLAVFRTTDNRFFALDNRSPHPKGGTMAEAIVSGHYAYCPVRDLKICLETGKVQEPDTGEAETFETKVENGEVFLYLP